MKNHSSHTFRSTKQQKDSLPCRRRSISHRTSRHLHRYCYCYYCTKLKAIKMQPIPIILVLILSVFLSTLDQCTSFPLQHQNYQKYLSAIYSDRTDFNIPTLTTTTRANLHLHLNNKMNGRISTVVAATRSNSNSPPSKSLSSSITKEERTLLQELNQFKNEIIDISKERKNDSNMNMDAYYNQQKGAILQMMKTFYSFQQKQDSDGDNVINYNVYMEASRIIDSVLRYCTNEVFSIMNYRNRNRSNGRKKGSNNKNSGDGDSSSDSDNGNEYDYQTSRWKQVQFGLDMMEMQLLSPSSELISSSSTSEINGAEATFLKQQKVLLSPYDTIPHSVCLQALKSLNTLLLQKQNGRISDINNSNEHSGLSRGEPTTATTTLRPSKKNTSPQIQQSHAAFRILQRLCTGIGIRDTNININALIEEMNSSSNFGDDNVNGSGSSPSTKLQASNSKSLGRVQINLDERDFNMVLNGFVTTNQMSQAHRVIALQVRTQHAPPLSPITYSILIKGYGKINDVTNVELCMKQSYENGIIPDIIMYNSLIDAYVNCNEIDLAFDIFEFLRDESRRGSKGSNGQRHRRRYYGSEGQQYLLRTQEEKDDNASDDIIPTPNIRTYNTMLKGFVKNADLKKAMKISNEMRNANLWDEITTNTLVSVAVASNEFTIAESILSNYTKNWSKDENGRQQSGMPNNYNKKRKQRYQQHPNVEAYSELLNGYAKSNKLKKALSTLKMMRQRGVNPNEYTYTSLINALAKAQKIDQAMQLMDFMESSDGIPAGVITYNALLTGMLEKYVIDGRRTNNDIENEVHDSNFNSRVDRAMSIFQIMIEKSDVRPNVITEATLIDALGRCKPSRIGEAKELVVKFHQAGLVASGNQRVATALIRACANSLDLDGIQAAYHDIHTPDTIAFNALIEGCCRCGKVRMALETMADNNDSYLNKDKNGYISPDVVTYTILMSAILKIGTSSASNRALLLYKEMKRVWGIMPDRALVDIILTAMISGGNSLGINDEDARFTMTVLRDAKHLDWKRGELRKREMAVKGVFMYRISEAWKEDEDKYGTGSTNTIKQSKPVDPLFKKKQWNQFDSGFSLWGRGSFDGGKVTKKKETDEFLESKKWNDIDSSFRII